MSVSFILLLADPAGQLLGCVPEKSGDCSSCYIAVFGFREHLRTGFATEFVEVYSYFIAFGATSMRLTLPLLVKPSYLSKEQVLNVIPPF